MLLALAQLVGCVRNSNPDGVNQIYDLTHPTTTTDWERINAMSDEAIDLSDIPEVTEEQMKRAVRRVGGKPVVNLKISCVIFVKSLGTQHN